MFDISDTEKTSELSGAKIKVIGIGGGGCNAVNTMIRAGLSGVEYIVANTDSQALNANLAPTKVQLGVEITKGLGAGANPEVGRKAALEEYEKLSEVLNGADMVFVTAGMGGGTGTGAAPVVAKLAREIGALTVGVVTKPFTFEGRKRQKQAISGIQSLEENVDSLITIPNQRLLQIAGETLSLVDTFRKADEVLLNAVQGIADLITNTGLINADFADVHTIMSNKGLALMGTGTASGENRAVKAATTAISSPLLEDINIDGATGLIINISGSSTLSAHETNEAVTLIMEAADEDAEIIWGTVIDDNMEDDVKITVIATGLKDPKANSILQKNREIKIDPKVTYVEEVKEVEVAPREEEVEVFVENKTIEEESPLKSKLREASNRYVEEREVAEDKIERKMERETFHPQKTEADAETSSDSSKSKARSIAEKLGFMNFDEEELDKPSYLRKDGVDNQL